MKGNKCCETFFLIDQALVEFTYCFPQKVIFGANACMKVPDEIVRLAKQRSRVLVVTDKNIANAGIEHQFDI